MRTKERVVLVTGANRGLGFEVCRQLAKKGYSVVLSSRDFQKGKQAARKLCEEGIEVAVFELDVTKHEQIRAVASFIYTEFGRLDVLINNAGVLLEPGAPINMEIASIFNTRLEALRQSMETNVYGPLNLCQVLVPIMRMNDYGRIVNVSSGMGQFSSMTGGWASYRISKAALNAVTCIFSAELEGTNILVNSACPGWVQTDMGGNNAPLTTAEAAITVVWLATLPDGGPSGKFFRNKEQIDW